MRPTWAEIDLDVLRGNVSRVVDVVAPSSVCAVVKADAYGHGDVPVAEAALDAGATTLAVALVEEGIRLREAGIDAPILLLSEPMVEDLPTVVRWRLIPTIYHEETLDSLSDSLDQSEPLSVHIKLDTGMHRVGSTSAEMERIKSRVVGDPKLSLGGIWTHFAVADEDEDFTNTQIQRFRDAQDGSGVPTHLANTAGALAFPGARAEMVRLGIGMYGYHPSEATEGVVELEPVMRLVSRVTHVARHPAGTRPSYGRRRPLPSDATVVTVPIGYADGVPRILSARGGEVLIRGRRFALAGTVTMDQIVVDVGDEPVEIGDEVVLLGTQGTERITADDWARANDTISYEIVCGVGPRVPRRYLEGGSVSTTGAGEHGVDTGGEGAAGVLLFDGGKGRGLTRTTVVGVSPHESPAVRDGEADAIELTDDMVAATHCVVVVEDDGVSLVDLASPNGTVVSRGEDNHWLESERPFPLTDGDVLLLGRQRITYREKQT
ncbi:MAG: alanine racemase [Acidimicrobiia bacterium]|nr:alanine racemase [Acidimicrobiia bacterium]